MLKPVRNPIGRGRRGEGIWTAVRRSGQSCAPTVDDRWSRVDSDMLPSHDGRVSISLSEFAFALQDNVFDKASGCTRSYSEGAIPWDNSTSRSSHEAGRRRVVAGVATCPPDAGDLQNNPRSSSKAIGDHHEGTRSRTRETVFARIVDARGSTSRGWDGTPFLDTPKQTQVSHRREDGSSSVGGDNRFHLEDARKSG